MLCGLSKGLAISSFWGSCSKNVSLVKSHENVFYLLPYWHFWLLNLQMWLWICLFLPIVSSIFFNVPLYTHLIFLYLLDESTLLLLQIIFFSFNAPFLEFSFTLYYKAIPIFLCSVIGYYTFSHSFTFNLFHYI